MALNRVKLLTSNTYSPTNPASESDIRSQIDGSIQEIADLLALTTNGASGADGVGATPIPALGTENTIQSILEKIVLLGVGTLPGANTLTELMMKSEMKKDVSGGVAAYDNTLKALATAANDFLIATGANAVAKKTLAETKLILGFSADGRLPQESVIAPTLLNSWVNFGAGYRNAGYWKDSCGVVHIRGIVKSGVVASAIFNLPAGYRPLADCIFSQTNNGAFGAVAVFRSGNVLLNSGSNVSLSLDGITFRAEE